MMKTTVKHKASQIVDKLLREAADLRGYRLQKRPHALFVQPNRELVINLELVVSHYLQYKNSPDFYFIQIGANDGIAHDPINHLVRKHKWQGVLIEPQTEAFHSLVSNYRDQAQLTFLNVAIAATNGVLQMHRPRRDIPNVPGWAQETASLRLDTVLSHKDLIPNIEELIERIDVDCISFDRLIDSIGVSQVDLLQIDTEGYDFEIIKMINFDRVKPAIIRYEHLHLTTMQQNECVELLIQHGYSIGLERSDTIAYQFSA